MHIALSDVSLGYIKDKTLECSPRQLLWGEYCRLHNNRPVFCLTYLHFNTSLGVFNDPCPLHFFSPSIPLLSALPTYEHACLQLLSQAISEGPVPTYTEIHVTFSSKCCLEVPMWLHEGRHWDLWCLPLDQLKDYEICLSKSPVIEKAKSV